MKQAKGAQTQNSSMITSQCFYTLATFTNSISLTVNLPLARQSVPKPVHAIFGKNGSTQTRQIPKNRTPNSILPNQKKKEPKKESAPPVPVSGLGDEAFWVRRFVGTLYVLKGDTILRISIGGKQDDATRQRKAQLLAKSALEKLP